MDGCVETDISDCVEEISSSYEGTSVSRLLDFMAKHRLYDTDDKDNSLYLKTAEEACHRTIADPSIPESYKDTAVSNYITCLRNLKQGVYQ